MRLSRLFVPLALATVATAPLFAQEHIYWIGNQNSGDIMAVTPWGKVVQRFAVGGGIRAAETSPATGLTWVLIDDAVDSIQLFDTNGPVGTPIVSAHYTQFHGVAFDGAGSAWVVGSDGSNTSGGVTEYDLIGNELGNYLLPELNPQGITIDSLGNKWIAHRNLFNAKVSRIDPAGVVVDFPVSGARPVFPIADFRGVGVPSHIWVQCDDNGTLLELDENGTELNSCTVAPDISGSPVVDLNGYIWVRKSNDANLYQVDPANGAVINTYPITSPTDPAYTGINGMGIDTLGRILAVQRLNFGPPQPQPAPPCEIHRIDPATGTIEVSTSLVFGGNEAWGTVLAPSTPFHFATVVDPNGDADGDGDNNLTEIMNGTSPVDGASDSRFSVDTTGNSGLGGTVFINVRQNSGADIWGLAYGSATLPAPIAIPGFVGNAVIDPATVFEVTPGVGTNVRSLPVPVNPALVGSSLYIQGLFFDGVALNLRNTTGISIW